MERAVAGFEVGTCAAGPVRACAAGAEKTNGGVAVGDVVGARAAGAEKIKGGFIVGDVVGARAA
eukprot:1986349-Rhodomonas_salina.1